MTISPVIHNSHIQQHSLWQSVGLHLLPGALLTIVFIALMPTVTAIGFPPLLAFLIAALFVALPLELGYLLYQGRKLSRRFVLEGIVLFRDAIPFWQYFVLIPLMLVLATVLLNVALPLGNILTTNVFFWLPSWFFFSNVAQYTQYSQPVLVVTFSLRLILLGIALPIVEELYFRGYLLPRISRFGRWSPLINGLLFTLYHFWQPFDYPIIFAVVLPLAYTVAWKRNIYLGIISHVAVNVLGALGPLALILGMG